ncbi:MAG: MFS transporter [Amphritea sp.]|nr:MFS transporter [Amphritea sp.]
MSQYRLLIVISLSAALLMVGVGMIVPLLPQRIISLSGSIQSVGYLASFFALSYLLLQLPIGAMADRLGIKPFLVLGYLCCGISGVVYFLADTTDTIFWGRIIQGAGEAPIWALGPALLSLAYPNAKGKAIGIYNAAIHAGLTLGPLAGILLFPAGTSNTPFLIFAAACCFVGTVVMIFLPAPRANVYIATTPRVSHLIRLFYFRESLLTLAGIFLYGAAYGIFTSVLPAYLALAKGFDNLDIGVFFALFYLAISVSQLIAGPLSDRFGRNLFMIAGLVTASIGTSLFNIFPGVWTYLLLTLASFGLGIFCVASMAHLNECAPDSLKSSVSGSYYLAWGSGFLIGPILTGRFDNIIGQGNSYAFLALLMFVLALALKFPGQPSKDKLVIGSQQ